MSFTTSPSRRITKAAVLGSGVMGSQIACHFANIGLEVVLLDIVPKEPNEKEKAKGLDISNPQVRNRIVNEALASAIKLSPAPLYHKDFSKRITTGNFEDNLKEIGDADWVIEVVVENLDIKKKVFDQVEKYRQPGSLITSNTSGIPIHTMLEGRSDDFKKHFCGTHFFNPPRYLKLLEIIPTKETSPEVVDFLMEYGRRYLGKTTVLAKDTPAFIANRVGVWAMMDTINIMQEIGLNVSEIDRLTGTVIGHPKSATFRTADVVGLDTFIKVASNLYQAVPKDERRDTFQLPDVAKKMEEQGMLGQKVGKGFFKKVRGEDGSSNILALNLDTLEYEDQAKPKFATLDMAKSQDDLKKRLPMLTMGQDKAGEFYRKMFAGLFSYAAHRIPEIADELYKIDDGLKAGFGWELGPFEYWDAFGLEQGIKFIEKQDLQVPSWVKEMKDAGHKSFYKLEKGSKLYYDVQTKEYKEIPGTEHFIILDALRDDEQKVVFHNAGVTLFDIGDGILNLEFHTKMNTLGAEVITGLMKSIEIAEKDFRGMVIANNGTNFSAGANLAMIFMSAVEQEFDEVNMMVAQFQKAVMRIRYSSIPIIVAPHALTLGGGCEMVLHADKVQAAAELYIGLVEVGVGIIPAGGGTKEMAAIISDRTVKGDPELNMLESVFMNLGTAKVATSAYEARDLYILSHEDGISVNKDNQICDAKLVALEMAEAGYTQKPQRKDIRVLGRGGIAMIKAGITAMRYGNYISEHDQKIGEKLAYVLCGGDLSYPQEVSEQYLLDLEREAFLSLCGERKTLERMEAVLQKGKPIRN